ncbi:MAG: hypothetical protein R3D68_12400 [Hyphomicrobiaceae bacterium]
MAAAPAPGRGRLVAALLAFLALSWLVITTSLADAVATSSPDLALMLSREHPVALITKAERARADLLELVTSESKAASEGAVRQGKGTRTAPSQAAVATPTAAERSERARLRGVIRDLAQRTLAVQPLNAAAYRMLGELSDDIDQTRIYMREAARRSRRETIAVFWLLNDSVAHNDAAAALEYADILLRTRPELAPPVMGYLAAIAASQTGRDVIARQMARRPPWRSLFYQTFPAAMRDLRVGLPLLAAIKSAGVPTTLAEGSNLIDTFLVKEQVDLAYAAWLSLLSPEELSRLGLLTNANFASEPSGVSFDWRIQAGTNAIAEFTRRPGDEAGEGRLLHVQLNDGRVRFPVVKQVIVLAPGRYRLTGQVRGSIIAKRGLQWDVRCLFNSPKKPLGETELFSGRMSQWRSFTVDFEVGASDNCEAQVVRLFHASRSASEEIISGEAWFDGLRLTRIKSAK